jgi:hypothetical protein
MTVSPMLALQPPTAVIITTGPSKLSEFMARLALSVNLTAAEYRRAQPRNMPSVPEAFGVLVC